MEFWKDFARFFFKRLFKVVGFLVAVSILAGCVIISVLNPIYIIPFGIVIGLFIIGCLSYDDAEHRKNLRESAWESRINAMQDWENFDRRVKDLEHDLSRKDLDPEEKRALTVELEHAKKTRDYFMNRCVNEEKIYIKHGGKL